MKKILLFLVLVFGVVLFTSIPAKTKVKSYYSGDALNFNNNLVVASTDSEGLELFSLGEDGLQRRSSWKPFDKRFNKNDSFYGVKLSIESGRLYAYAISGFTLYKYDVSDLSNPVLVKEMKNTYWEWYNKVDKFGDNIVTVSAKGVKVYNKDLETIDSYELTNEIPYNISSGGNENLIFSLSEDNDEIKIFDKSQRKITGNLQINFYGGNNNRSIYYDVYDDNIYFSDDRSVKKVGLDGSLKGTFEHLGYPGYDVSSTGNEYLYFANGLGVVKLKKSDMSVVTSRRTGDVTVDEGWAMGLKAVAMAGGERVVVFNNSSVLIMNSDLEVLGYAVAGQDEKTYAKENLFLNLSSAIVDSGTQVQVTGGGFLPNEELTVDFYNQKYQVKADMEGRFFKVLNAPELSNSNSRNKVLVQSENDNGMVIRNISERTDIKVTGNDSNYTYSIGLEIKDAIVENN